jgi:hypothetical protein
MEYKSTWTEADFCDMGWHDAVIYSMSFPQADCLIRFDIDYIFEWHWGRGKVNGWDIAPCTLEFNGVSDLKIAVDWKDQGDTWIQNISRDNSHTSPNGDVVLWNYKIELDIGEINFIATGYTQILRMKPIFSDSLTLGRPL